ncbi:aminopeptidase N [Nakamurella panacisegetis]|uniref:Aminopeptidase N n=1 Tax=Nakamurella panacisegetis TaxID=1090615 RepID=A0A1H0T559_9ACTN|nr:aminopeptidase N [Nakamurella panacisegetis]SDP49099.1 aminopeptidase N [Nakamurella panacisegetis]
MSVVHAATGSGHHNPSQPPNLTRAQAAERSAALSVQSYRVDLDLTDGAGGPGEKTFATRSEVSFSATPGTTTFIDFVGDGIATATLNGKPVDVSGWTNAGGLALTDLEAENLLAIEAVGLYTNTGEGLHRFVDPVDGAVYLYSQFETADAKRLFACFDQPDLKARFTFDVTAPAHWQVVTGGAATGVDTAPPGSGGASVHHFATTQPMSTYITALIAGPYHVVRDHHDGIDLGLYCRSTLAEHLDSERILTETKQGFDFFHGAFGVRYPFGKYDQLFVPEFNAGAMENAGAVTFREEYVFRSKVTHYLYERRCETILHEMAHMWFGDLVTMRWWDDLWLNESFATWASVVAQNSATEYTTAWTTFANVEKSWAYVQDQLPSTHPIAADMVDLAAVEVNFDGITYAKGASVLKQLAAYVGFEPFLAGLGTYFREFAFANASLDDLMKHLTDASGRDLSGWTSQWLQTTGINPLHAEFEVGPDGRYTSFEVVQGGAEPGAGELRTHRLAVGIYDDAEGRLVRTHRVELDVTGARTAVPGLVGVAHGALVLANDDDLTYCKLALDQDSLATAISRIGDIADSLPRTLVWSAVWEMTRDAKMRARDFVELALTGVHGEDQIGVVQRVLSQVHLAIGSYSDPDWAATTGWPRFTAALLDLATSAEPGSDVQLAAVQSLCAASLSADQLEIIQGWRDESAPLAGLTVDADLAWTLLNALVAHGVAGVDDIEAASTVDATASGERRAMTARSLRPDAAAKAAVWERLIEDDGMANAMQDAAIAGFSHPAQLALLEPYATRYFEVVDQVWSRRSIEVAQKVAVGLYPRWSIRPEMVDRAVEWAGGEHATALARLVSEGRSGTERALRARAYDQA